MSADHTAESLEVYLDRDRIKSRITELGAQIQEHYRNKPLVVVCVLKGSFIFAADLVRAIRIPLRVEFLGVRSYGDTTNSSGVVEITQDLTRSIEGEHVLIVEDIVDTGLTSAFLIRQLQTRGPASVKLCALLHKPARAQVEVPVDYLGFTIRDEFVVGFGLDFAQRYRNLPDICIYRGPVT